MKKSFLVFALLFVVFLGKVSAQRSAGKVSTHDISFRPTEGSNTVQIPNGEGTIRFVKRGESFSNVMFQDATGKIVRLSPNDGSEGSPMPECKCPMPDACFATEDKNIGLCMCKPCDLSTGIEGWNVRLRRVEVKLSY